MVTIREGGYYRDAKGEKRGPMLWEDAGWFFVENERGCWLVDGSAEDSFTGTYIGDLIAEWTDGPVRTVTRTVEEKQVEPGTYSRVNVGNVRGGRVHVILTADPEHAHKFTSDELKAAAAVLLELAGALSDGE